MLTPQQKKFKKVSRQCKHRKNYLACMSAGLKGKHITNNLTKKELFTIRNVLLLTPPTFFVGGGMIQLYKLMFGITTDTFAGTMSMIVVGLTLLVLIYKFVIQNG